MASTAVLSTLQHVTEMKLDKLSRQQKSFEQRRQAALADVEGEDDPVRKIEVLVAATKKHLGDDHYSLMYEHKNIERFLLQAKHDTSISPSLLNDWRRKFERELEVQHQRYRFTSLFGNLVTEWIKNPNETVEFQRRISDDGSGSDSFETVGREEMHEQRKLWEDYALNERTTDPKSIEKYLDGLFVSNSKRKKTVKSPLETLRTDISEFESRGLTRFNETNIKQSIDGLLKADLFTGEKRRALVDLKSQKAVLREMADVLNTELDALEDWNWDPVPIRLNMRKQINGKYRVYMDEELYHAIFIQWIGMSWAVYLKRRLVDFCKSSAWTQAPYRARTRRDMRRRQHFLGTEFETSRSVRDSRRDAYLNTYFLTQLPGSIKEGSRDYGVDDESDDDGFTASSPLEVKKELLALVTTESLVNTHIYGKFTVLQSDFKWFGPSLPHSTIFATLKYFGVEEKWLDFFKRFLQVPVVFAHDGDNAEPRTRKCGIPMSHVLADAMGETVLFVLDYAVNQGTKGGNLYRFHDDLWFWGQPESCVEAWRAIREFCTVSGLELNEEKTGACQVIPNAKSQALPKGLPKGDVRWGFLKMDPVSGRWTVDGEQIKDHTKELKRQLLLCRSVFAYVEAYNSYLARFFLNNLGPMAVCLGHQHIEMAVSTIESIQKDLFAGDESSEGSIAGHLKRMIEQRFGEKDILDAFIFFPAELGGLGVQIPLISLISKWNDAKEPDVMLQESYEKEEEAYEKAKEKYEAGKIRHTGSSSEEKIPDDEPFMSFEEYTRFREQLSPDFEELYSSLLEQYPTEPLKLTPDMHTAKRFANYNSIDNDWILEMYGRDALEKFGSLRMGEKELLPIGLLGMLKSEKVRWQG